MEGYNSSKGLCSVRKQTLVNVDIDVQRRIVAMFKGRKATLKTNATCLFRVKAGQGALAAPANPLSGL